MDDKQVLDWIRERVTIEQETLGVLETNNVDFGNEYLEGKISGLRDVYYHILKCMKG